MREARLGTAPGYDIADGLGRAIAAFRGVKGLS